MPVHKPPLTDGSATAMNEGSLPELAEADFFSQVFRVTPDNSATIIDSLLAQAVSLGIPVSRPHATTSTTDNKHIASNRCGAGPDASHASHADSDTSHERSASTETKSSASATLTSAASDDNYHDSTANALSRKRSRTLAFSQYDKFLAQVDPSLDQPKPSNLPPPPERHKSTPSLFSVSTRKSYLGIRNGILKIRRRHRSMPPFPEVIIKYVHPAATLAHGCRADQI